VDWRYQLDLVCKIKGEEFVAKVERNYLDTLDQQTALQIALDLPDVQKLIPSGECQVLSFKVEPGFRALLSIREKKLPATTEDPRTDNDTMTRTSKQI
jgi:hypothetical protein